MMPSLSYKLIVSSLVLLATQGAFADTADLFCTTGKGYSYATLKADQELKAGRYSEFIEKVHYKGMYVIRLKNVRYDPYDVGFGKYVQVRNIHGQPKWENGTALTTEEGIGFCKLLQSYCPAKAGKMIGGIWSTASPANWRILINIQRMPGEGLADNLATPNEKLSELICPAWDTGSPNTNPKFLTSANGVILPANYTTGDVRSPPPPNRKAYSAGICIAPVCPP